MKVVEDFESRPHKAVSFVVEREKEIQEWHEQKLPTVLPGFLAHNARKRCIKKNFKGIHDRFQRDSVYRDSQLKIGWTEEKCIEMDELAQKDFTHCPSSEEYERY